MNKRTIAYVIAIIIHLLIAMKVFSIITSTLQIENPYTLENTSKIVSALGSVAVYLIVLAIITGVALAFAFRLFRT